MKLYIVKLTIIEFRWNNSCMQCYQTLFLRSRVWGTRLTNIEVFPFKEIDDILLTTVIGNVADIHSEGGVLGKPLGVNIEGLGLAGGTRKHTAIKSASRPFCGDFWRETGRNRTGIIKEKY